MALKKVQVGIQMEELMVLWVKETILRLLLDFSQIFVGEVPAPRQNSPASGKDGKGQFIESSPEGTIRSSDMSCRSQATNLTCVWLKHIF